MAIHSKFSITIRRKAAKMEECRAALKKRLGPKYNITVAPYMVVLERDAKSKKIGMTQAADELLAYMRAKGRRHPIFRIILFAAALDGIERNKNLDDLKN